MFLVSGLIYFFAAFFFPPLLAAFFFVAMVASPPSGDRRLDDRRSVHGVEYKGAHSHVKTLLAFSAESRGRSLSQEPRLRVHRERFGLNGDASVRAVGVHHARLHNVGQVRAENLLSHHVDEARIRAWQ